MRIDIVQELTGRFMRVMVEEDREHFGTDMLSYNDVEGIMSAEIHNVDREPQFVYQVGNMISVSELFEKKVFTSRELLCLMEQIIDILNRCADYFLEGGNLILGSDYMFYDEEKKRLRVAYLDGLNSDVGEGISKLLEKFMDTMNHRDKELVFLVYGMHRIGKDSHFNLEKLSAFVAESRPGETAEKRKYTEQRIEETDTTIRERKTMPKEVVPMKEEKVKNHGKCILFLVAGIVLAAVVIKSGLLAKPVTGDLDVKKTVVFILALVAAEGYLFGKERDVKRHAKETTDVDKDADLDKTTLLTGAGLDETVVLEKQESVTWYLNLVPEDWQREEIKVRKSPFFIGKDPARANAIIGDGEVSRIHAKFVVEPEGVFLIDQDSTNGTFLNERQLVPWERCRIKSGDMIGISSIYYRAELYQ